MRTKTQLITMIAAAAWVSSCALLADDLFTFTVFVFPALSVAGLIYTYSSRRIRLPTLVVLSSVLAWLSVVLAIGRYDCCAMRHYNPLGDGDYHQLKTADEVTLEITRLSLPAVLFGGVAIWWFRKRYSEEQRQLKWEIENSPVNQPFPKVSVEAFRIGSAFKNKFSFYCYCGMEVIDELPKSDHFFVGCPSGCHEYELQRKGRNFEIVSCR